MVKKYKVVITKNADKDKEKIKQFPVLKSNVDEIIRVLEENPYKNPPKYEKLAGSLKGLYSRRINKQHRLVYKIFEQEGVVKIISMWTHYE
jgi:Txe/YoeB family toxin of toxin-antitoxin system